MVEFEYMIIDRKPKTDVYSVNVKSTGNPLGTIKYHPAWRQYVFFPFGSSLFSSSCLMDLIKFLKKVNKDLREKSPSYDYMVFDELRPIVEEDK